MPTTNENPILFSSEHTFFYDTREPVTARSLADSLIGLEDLIERSAPLLEQLLGGIKIKDVRVEFTSIQVGSYKENLIVRIFCGKGRAMEKKIEEFRKAFKLDSMGPKTVAAVAVGTLILYVAWQQLKPGDPARIHIENSFNSFGSELNLTGEEVKGIIEATMGTKKAQIQRDVSRITNPGGVKHKGSITLDNQESLQIPDTILDYVPVGKGEIEEVDPIEEVADVDMIIRAGDLDSPDSGWAAIIPSIKDARVPLHVSRDVNRDKLVFGKYMKANVTIVYRTVSGGRRIPRRYILTKHIEPDSPPAPVGLVVNPP
jgi:hypothetical protein